MRDIDIRIAAQEIFHEEFSVTRPFRLQWEMYGSMYVKGPSIEIDYLEGVPSSRDKQIACASFYDDHMTVHVYEKYRPLFRCDGNLELDYADPRFPDLAMEALRKIMDHHMILIEGAKDEYLGFVLEKKREGHVLLEAVDLPPEHQDSW